MSNGWIIQGSRGKGKSLCAVGKIREYMLKGRPIATNLDLFLEHLLPPDNNTVAYRLPDHPRLEDFEILPPAYDPKYKPDDKNGLLVLDELGTWLNSRSWNDKTRLQLMNWLFLSRKNHWDLILLAQDYEMIDTQIQKTLCDHLVESSRLDNQSIPFIAPILRFFGLSGFFPRIHRYHVFNGMSMQVSPVETWTFTGKDFYNGYDTNQRFLNGMEALNGTMIDMRATFQYLPANYLTNHIHIQRKLDEIEKLKQVTKFKTKEDSTVAKKGAGSEVNIAKIGLLSFGLLVFLGWRFFSGGFNLPKPDNKAVVQSAPAVVEPQQVKEPVKPAQSVFSSNEVAVEEKKKEALTPDNFIEYLMTEYRPRLSSRVYSEETGFIGSIDFYRGAEMVETYSIESLHSFGVVLLKEIYGARMVYKGKEYVITRWHVPSHSNSAKIDDVVADPSADKI